MMGWIAAIIIIASAASFVGGFASGYEHVASNCAALHKFRTNGVVYLCVDAKEKK